MRNIDIKVILEKHKKWLNSEKDGKYANLRGANLRGANLRGANLSDANLWDADLSAADLSAADLSDANLRGANLRGANLWDADLSAANLRGANLNVKIPPTNSHYFIAEILFRESKNFKERSWAGSIKISTDWCWDDFKKNCPKSMIAWAKKILCSKWTEFEEKFK